MGFSQQFEGAHMTCTGNSTATDVSTTPSPLNLSSGAGTVAAFNGNGTNASFTPQNGRITVNTAYPYFEPEIESGLFEVVLNVVGDTMTTAKTYKVDLRKSTDGGSTYTAIAGSEFTFSALTGQLANQYTCRAIVALNPNDRVAPYVTGGDGTDCTFSSGLFSIRRIA